jgi:hypothetical protein
MHAGKTLRSGYSDARLDFGDGRCGGGLKNTLAELALRGNPTKKKEEFPGFMKTCCLGTPFPRSALFL